MYFGMKNILKNNHNHTLKQARNQHHQSPLTKSGSNIVVADVSQLVLHLERLIWDRGSPFMEVQLGLTLF
jgi:hypothetical protein